MKRNLLDEIESGALDSAVSLADTLRKCVALGGRAGSVELRDWARSELDGYKPGKGFPKYRKVPAPLALSGSTWNAVVKDQTVSPLALPEFARDGIREVVPFLQGVGELEALVASTDGSIRIAVPGSADLALYMNSKTENPGQHITDVYWIVVSASVAGILDRVRTNLVSLVAEIRAIDKSGSTPSAEVASQAVNVVINGKARDLHLTTVSTNGSATSTVGAPLAQSGGAWTALRKPGVLIVGFATVVAGISGVAVWLNWSPF